MVLNKKIYSHYKPMENIGAWSVWTPGARLAQIIIEISKHCYIRNVAALGLVVSEKKFLVFPIVSLWEIVAAGAWLIWTPGARLEQFKMGTTKHCYIQNIEALLG